MLAILLGILGAILTAVSVFKFFGNEIVYLAQNISWASSELGQLPDLFPDFLQPFLAVALCLAVLAIIVKVI